ncbi:MAG: tetratricopeptide repeat protein [Ktedonobacteraceae bacterium]|nr:tetratricopeptide repeat protein [Ktedonobacteraceae bacterium]
MSSKKQKNHPKKQSTTSVSQEEESLVQQQLANYQQTAAGLYQSSDTGQAEAVLSSITDLSESAQIVLLQALAREKTTEAADVLLAVNTFAPLKEARKEARRSLIRLEGNRIYPRWTPPSPPAPAIEEISSTNSARFWKGQFTDTRITGEMQLLLFWKQGDNYQEVRTLGFLLEFFHDGVKDFFTEVNSKRQVENRMERMRAQFGSMPIVDCSLTEAKRLLEEALEVNQQYGTKPHPDYTRNLPLVRRLVLDAPDDTSEMSDSGQLQTSGFDEARKLLDQLMALELDPEETVAGFLDTWLRGDYEAAYTALAKDSPLRAGLTAEEWVARRRLWAEQAQPTQGRSEIAYRNQSDDEDYEEEDNDISSSPEAETIETHPEAEAFWSLALTDATADGGMKELPQATIVYKATGRHWFWTKYTLVREGNEWRIFAMTDAGAEALQLPREELQQQLAEIVEFASEQLDLVEAIADDEKDVEDEEGEELEEDELEEEEDEDGEDFEDLEFEELAERFEEMMWVTTRAMHYTDALITQMPEDSSLYDMGYDQATAIQENERAAAYVEMQAERFPEIRGEALRKLAVVQLNIAATYEENNDEERAHRFIEEVEKTLRTSIATDDAPMGSILLAQTLITQNKQLEEAEQLLQQVLTRQEIETTEATLAEAALGTIAQTRENLELALQHYQRAAEMSPDLPGIWFNIGLMQRRLGQLEEAEESYRRSIDESPTETGAYVDLAGIYTDGGDLDAAEEVLEEGLEINPEAADLLAGMALVYVNKGDLRHAKEYLDDAEDIDADLDIVQAVRLLYDGARQIQKRQQKPKGKSRKFKKK